jgi:hypothetical protein
MNKAEKCTFLALRSMKTAAGMYKINNEERLGFYGLSIEYLAIL